MPRRLRERLTDEERKKRRREQKKLSMRRARSKLSAFDIEERRRKDRERYQQKKERGLIKTIADFTSREQRRIRKIWREKAKIRREKAKLTKRTEEIENQKTPTPSPSPSTSFSRTTLGRNLCARNRRQMKAKHDRLCKRLELLENKLAKYRMRLVRLKKKQGFLHETENKRKAIKKQIIDFLLDDENSRLTAGKKETITRRKVKKQIRLLNDTLSNLHKTFINKTGLQVSYSNFRRCRPFWVIFPKATERKTCLCSLHTNNDLIVKALHHAKTLPFSSATDVVKSLCCNNSLNVSCLERKCLQCQSNELKINITNENDTIIYQRWITKNVTVTIKGQEKQCKKTIKETVKTTQRLLIQVFRLNLPKFMQHIANIVNQFKVIRSIKLNMIPSEGLLHIDFSENYACKYGEEIQSAHFGGSKAQLSLHTCVYYSTNFQPPKNQVKATSVCTVSENLRHDPVLICAHLKPVIEEIQLLTPNLKVLHILSDSPTTQYRNKTMFYMIAEYLSRISKVDTIIWHFSEAGHGKGAPDGVGGCIKRICDNAVANGHDISGIDSFLNCLKDNIKNIKIFRINDEYVDEIQQVAALCKSRPFKGTFQIHQVSWSKLEPNKLHARRLSCITCPAHAECSHYEIGQIVLPWRQPLINIPSSAASSPTHFNSASSNLACNNSAPPSPVSSPARANSVTPSPDPASPVSSPARASSVTPSPDPASPASTVIVSIVTGPRSPRTPDPPENIRQPLTPRKRLNFQNIFSDESNSPHPKKFKSVSSFFDSDSSDENLNYLFN